MDKTYLIIVIFVLSNVIIITSIIGAASFTRENLFPISAGINRGVAISCFNFDCSSGIFEPITFWANYKGMPI